MEILIRFRKDTKASLIYDLLIHLEEMSNVYFAVMVEQESCNSSWHTRPYFQNRDIADKDNDIKWMAMPYDVTWEQMRSLCVSIDGYKALSLDESIAKGILPLLKPITDLTRYDLDTYDYATDLNS